MKKKRRTRRNYLGLFIAVFFITIILVCAVVGGVYMVMQHNADTAKTDDGKETAGEIESYEADIPAESDETADTAGESDESEATDEPDETDDDEEAGNTGRDPDKNYITVEISEEELQTGSLILANPDHEYTRPDEGKLPTIYEKKTRNYKVSSSATALDGECIDAINDMMADFVEATGRKDVIVRDGYRSYDDQMDIYSAYVNSYGIAAAEGNVAVGGCSDHNTALGFDLAVYTDDGATEKLSYDTTYNYLINNCYKYGIVRRYSTPKNSITKLYEEWHFRYVGVPHAYYMRKCDYCLEEYLDALREYPCDGEHLTFSDDEGHSWEIFSVPVTNDGKCSFEIADDAEYTVSGTNCGFAVVTVAIN